MRVLLLLLILPLFSNGQNIDSLVAKISKINIVESEKVGFGGMASRNYKNYIELSKIASISELIDLTNHKNKTVACYAGWALVKINYTKLPDILIKFLNTDYSIQRFSGCVQRESHLSSEFYGKYYWSVRSKKATDLTLKKMDSILIHHKKSKFSALSQALKNRVYPNSFNVHIADMAFTKDYYFALDYLYKWYRADYSDKLLTTMTDKFIKRNYSLFYGTKDYFEDVNKILAFETEKSKDAVIQKLKIDKEWEKEKMAFMYLLKSYNIYESDLE